MVARFCSGYPFLEYSFECFYSSFVYFQSFGIGGTKSGGGFAASLAAGDIW